MTPEEMNDMCAGMFDDEDAHEENAPAAVQVQRAPEGKAGAFAELVVSVSADGAVPAQAYNFIVLYALDTAIAPLHPIVDVVRMRVGEGVFDADGGRCPQLHAADEVAEAEHGDRESAQCYVGHIGTALENSQSSHFVALLPLTDTALAQHTSPPELIKTSSGLYAGVVEIVGAGLRQVVDKGQWCWGLAGNDDADDMDRLLQAWSTSMNVSACIHTCTYTFI